MRNRDCKTAVSTSNASTIPGGHGPCYAEDNRSGQLPRECRAYAARVSEFDPAALGGQLRAVAESLHATSENVQHATQQAQDETLRLGDDDGLADVEVDGRARVREIRLSHAALRDADRLDVLLTGLLNRALSQARANTQQAVVAALPPTLRRDVIDAEEGR
jgi:DNA-binding protein YbaB